MPPELEQVDSEEALQQRHPPVPSAETLLAVRMDDSGSAKAIPDCPRLLGCQDRDERLGLKVPESGSSVVIDTTEGDVTVAENTNPVERVAAIPDLGGIDLLRGEGVAPVPEQDHLHRDLVGDPDSLRLVEVDLPQRGPNLVQRVSPADRGVD